jgi:uncharacterized membrane protein YdjX (TVP38/TMEM64 family)
MSAARPPRVTVAALLGLLAIATAAALILQPSSDDVEELFDGSGVLGPALFTAVYALLTVAFVPGTPLTIAAGALYGADGGFAVTMAGASLGATGAFVIGRHAARSTVARATGPRLAALERRFAGRGFYALLVLRLIPVIPFNALNYAAGASPIGARDYMLATVVGIGPGALAYAALGAGLDDPVSPLFLGAAGAVVGLAVLARALAGRVGVDGEEGADGLPPVPQPATRADEAGTSGDHSGGEVRRLLWSLAFFVIALTLFIALFAVGLFH